jgi:hypothetical protein
VTKRLTERELEHDRANYRIGTHGAASEVRKIDLASVDTAALVEQLVEEKTRWGQRAQRRAGNQPDDPV